MVIELIKVDLTTQFGKKMSLSKDSYIISLYTSRLFIGSPGGNIPSMNNEYTHIDCRIMFHPKIKGINTLDDVFLQEGYDQTLYEEKSRNLVEEFEEFVKFATISEILFVDNDGFEFSFRKTSDYNKSLNTIEFEVMWKPNLKDDIEILKSYL
jgi:hypothetical protein